MTGDGIDSHAPGQELLYTIRAAIAHDQWLRYREGFRRSAANSVGRGIHHCVTPPLGYRFVHEETDKHLERDPESAPALKELFDRKVAGESNPSLARWLKEQGYEYTTQGVQKVLKNRAYLGEARYGGFVTEEAHEALISNVDI